MSQRLIDKKENAKRRMGHNENFPKVFNGFNMSSGSYPWPVMSGRMMAGAHPSFGWNAPSGQREMMSENESESKKQDQKAPADGASETSDDDTEQKKGRARKVRGLTKYCSAALKSLEDAVANCKGGAEHTKAAKAMLQLADIWKRRELGKSLPSNVTQREEELAGVIDDYERDQSGPPEESDILRLEEIQESEEEREVSNLSRGLKGVVPLPDGYESDGDHPWGESEDVDHDSKDEDNGVIVERRQTSARSRSRPRQLYEMRLLRRYAQRGAMPAPLQIGYDMRAACPEFNLIPKSDKALNSWVCAMVKAYQFRCPMTNKIWQGKAPPRKATRGVTKPSGFQLLEKIQSTWRAFKQAYETAKEMVSETNIVLVNGDESMILRHYGQQRGITFAPPDKRTEIVDSVERAGSLLGWMASKPQFCPSWSGSLSETYYGGPSELQMARKARAGLSLSCSIGCGRDGYFTKNQFRLQFARLRALKAHNEQMAQEKFAIIVLLDKASIHSFSEDEKATCAAEGVFIVSIEGQITSFVQPLDACVFGVVKQLLRKNNCAERSTFEIPSIWEAVRERVKTFNQPKYFSQCGFAAKPVLSATLRQVILRARNEAGAAFLEADFSFLKSIFGVGLD